MGQPNPRFTTILKRDRRNLRVRLIREEFKELRDALRKNDLIGIMDGIGDLLYVTYGLGVEMGLPVDKIFEEISQSNLTKLWPDGKPRLREDGKVLKPPTFQKPDLNKFV